jgi:HEAT repeat protein
MEKKMNQSSRSIGAAVLVMALQASALAQPAGSGGLVEQLRSANPQVRSQAAQGLERNPPADLRSALPYVSDATRDAEGAVRRSAMIVLWRAAISSTEGEALVGSVLPVVIERVSDQDPEVRAIAARLLGLVGKPSRNTVVQALTKLAIDANEAVRVAALHGLGAVSQSTQLAVPTLLQRMRVDGAADARGAAAFSLRYATQDAATIAALILALDDPSTHVKSQAAATLGYIGRPALSAAPSLSRLATMSTDAQLREDASYALKSIQANNSK